MVKHDIPRDGKPFKPEKCKNCSTLSHCKLLFHSSLRCLTVIKHTSNWEILQSDLWRKFFLKDLTGIIVSEIFRILPEGPCQNWWEPTRLCWKWKMWEDQGDSVEWQRKKWQIHSNSQSVFGRCTLRTEPVFQMLLFELLQLYIFYKSTCNEL